MENYDRSLIDLWTKKYPAYENPFIALITRGDKDYKWNGKYKIKKSKYRLINWLRKITKTEKYEKEYEFIYKTL